MGKVGRKNASIPVVLFSSHIGYVWFFFWAGFAFVGSVFVSGFKQISFFSLSSSFTFWLQV